MEKMTEIFAYVFGMSAFRYFLIAGIPFALFYYVFKAKVEKYKIQQRAFRRKDAIREIMHSAQATFVFSIIAFVVLFTPITNYTLIYTDINDYPSWWIGVSLILSLIIHDTYFYWMHRLLHHKKIYKYTHAVHHKSVNPSPWASYSFHVLESLAEGLILFVLVFILPMHQITILLFTVIGFMINVYGHLGYEIAPKALRNSIVFEIINTSVHHNLHHSQFKGNYGLYFRFWDRMMKTENPNYVKHYDMLAEKRQNSLAANEYPANIGVEGK
ncbi:MAG: sterol desaturase family protein [Flavobacterium sp.]|nr:MAG: sterol desaturase family protein [Flavobacterium sp.]